MPIVKKNDVLPERPVIIVLYGVPGSGKTSVATTADNPLLIDCDRGADRAVQRCDTIMAKCWKDIDSMIVFITIEQPKLIRNIRV